MFLHVWWICIICLVTSYIYSYQKYACKVHPNSCACAFIQLNFNVNNRNTVFSPGFSDTTESVWTSSPQTHNSARVLRHHCAMNPPNDDINVILKSSLSPFHGLPLFICIINMCILLQDVLFWLELFFLDFICQNKIIFISYDLFYTSLCSGGRGMLRGGEKN